MNVLDTVIPLVVLVGILGGYRLGFVTRVASWIGMGVGILVAVRILPWVLRQVSGARGPTALLIALGVLFGSAMAFQAIGFAIGVRLRPRSMESGAADVDRGLGALAGGLGVAAAVWLLVPLAARTPGTVASLTANSALARWVASSLPAPPDTMSSLQSVVGDGFPQVFDALRPTPEVGPPPAASGLSTTDAARVARSVVKVEGVACNRIQDGSGFVVADGLVATNAHVVAGEERTQVQRDDGSYVDADVVLFDPARDLALLRVPRLDRPPLPIGESVAGAKGGVFGHPGGEPLRIAPFAVSTPITATGKDIYGGAVAEREVLVVAASLRPGDSGAALVDAKGRVVGVAFAVAPDRPGVAYALDTVELRAVLRSAVAAPVPTGRCLA